MAAPDLRVFADEEELAIASVDLITQIIAENSGRIALCLTGGSTPKRTYELLAHRDLPWQRVHLFWSDERFVAADDPRSNFAMARDALLARVAVQPQNVHPVPTDERSPEQSAARYEAELKRFYGAGSLDPARPLFDLVLNGLGDDGHTASLFPGMPTLDESVRWAVATEAGMEPRVPRVTLTFPALESCRHSVFLVSGSGKANIVRRVLSGADLPAARLKPPGSVVWLLDKDAAPTLNTA